MPDLSIEDLLGTMPAPTLRFVGTAFTPEIDDDDEPDIMESPRTCDACSERFDYAHEGQSTDCGDYRCDDCGYCSCCSCSDSCGCGDCDDYRSERPSAVREWNWRPYQFRPKGDYPSEVLMGVELEIHGSYQQIVDSVHEVDTDEYHLYLKEDGSIDGAEIVTHPMTLRWAREYDPNSSGNGFDEVLRGLRLRGCSVDDDYGLHVHVSRAAFQPGPKQARSAIHQLTWLLFNYRNAVQLEKLARRQNRQYASFRKGAGVGELVEKAKAHGSYDSERYTAINCNNEKTYELRFFGATLNTEEFWAALEYADASVEYTRHIKSSDVLRDGALSWGRFADWVNANDYPNLASQLEVLALV